MDLGDYKFDFNAARRRDRDLVTDAGVPEREEHSLAGVATEPARGRPPPATRATPTASSSTPASTVNERGMRLFSDAERMPSERASVADRRTRAAAKLRERGFGALLLSPGADLFYLA